MAAKPLQIYVTETEKDLLREASDMDRRSLSGFIVLAALRAAKEAVAATTAGGEDERSEGEA